MIDKITKIKLLLLLCFLGLFGFPLNSVHAAVTGKVGVGTWGNTQAEFTDIKVVKGTSTLYQSNFTSGMTGWTTVNGTWGTDSGNLRQTGTGSPALAFVGETTWSDYTLTLKARKISGDEGFLIAVGSLGDATTSWWNIGGWGNTKHVLQVPGFTAPDYAGTVQTNVWYDIKVELSGNDIRCSLNGTVIHEATRMLDASDRTARFNQLINSAGFGLLNGIEQAGLRDLAGRDVWIGAAARATFDAVPRASVFEALTPAQQALIIRKVNRNRMTWQRGWGYGSDTWRDNYITDNMDYAVWRYNSLGVFDKHLTANNSPGTPTADGGYDGQLRFGGAMNRPTCVHEINHTLGAGTYWRWGQLLVNGTWTGQNGNRQVADFNGAGTVITQAYDAYHFQPYGLINEPGDDDWNKMGRSILTMAGIRRDMGLGDQLNWNYDTGVPNGTYTLVPRHVPGKVLNVTGGNTANSSPLSISSPTGNNSQKFIFDLQPEGTYRIRTALSGNHTVELPGGNTDNGSALQLWDDNGSAGQRWFLIPTDSGYYKIAPLNNNFKGLDTAGTGSADGTVVQSWDYYDNFGQQWKLVPSEQVASTTTVANGTYTLTPRHAQDKVLEVYGFAGASGDAVDIWTANDGDNQKFLLDKQSDGTYRIRTNLTGNRVVEMPDGNTDNGSKVKLTDNTNSDAQRWYLIPTDNGWFKIAPKNNITKGLDVAGVSNADGALAQSWDYLGGNNQQWKLTRTEAVFDLSANTYTGAESAGTASVTVTRSGNTSNAVSVAYATSNGTAVQPGDYTATSGTLSFAANETSKSISVPIINDSLDEANETLTVTLSNPQGVAVLGETTSATVSITDNDATPGLSVADVSVTEGNSGTVNAVFTVTLSAASGQAVSVNYATADGTATAGSDYTATSGTLSFAAGTTSKTITVSVVGETTFEPNETFKVNLSAPVNATLTRAQATGTINNDDVDSTLPTLTVSTPAASPNNVYASLSAATGTASSNSGIASVTGLLYRDVNSATGATAAYWNWTTQSWNATYSPACERLATGTTSWSVAFPALTEGGYWFRATATGKNGKSALVGRTFLIDATPPSVTVTTPASSPGNVYASLTSATGTASSNIGIASVKGLLYRDVNSATGATAAYWNWTTQTWVATYSPACEGAATGTTNWSVAFPALAEGSYWFRATVFSKSGKSATSGKVFLIDATPPTVTITTPGASPNNVYASLSTATGTASSNSGIVSVVGLLCRQANSSTGTTAAYWNWTTQSWNATYSSACNRVATGTTSWSVALPSLTAGSYWFSATVQSKSGKTASSGKTFQIKSSSAPSANSG